MGQVTYFLFPPLFYADKHPFKAKKVPFFEILKKWPKMVIFWHKNMYPCVPFFGLTNLDDIYGQEGPSTYLLDPIPSNNQK